MSDIIDSAGIARDISLLYELALAVGQSLDLQTNCALFLKTLISRKNLAYAAVWIKDEYLLDTPQCGGATLVFASPEYRIRERQLPLTNPLFAWLDGKPAFSIASADSHFAELIAEKEVEDGTFAVFALGEIGALKLFSRTRKKPFEQVELGQLTNVINKFTVSLKGCLSHQRLLTMQQQLIDVQQAALRELATPLIPLADGVLVMPLIGAIDSWRAQQIMETLLEGIGQHRATTAIIDITGVRVLDNQVANSLIHAAQAAHLLGAEVVLTGVSPEIAQTIVHLGVTMERLVTYSTLQTGIAHTLRKRTTLSAKMAQR